MVPIVALGRVALKAPFVVNFPGSGVVGVPGQKAEP